MKKAVQIKVGIGLTVLLMTAGFGITNAVSPPAPAPPGSTIEQRIAQRKAERGIVLNDVDSKRVIDTCVNAQGKLRLIQTDAVSRLDKHIKVYKKIDARIWIAIGQLKLAEQDTFPLEKQRLELSDKTANFQLLVNNYEQSLDDSLVINCKADPTGFKSLLDTTRIYYDQLRSQSGDIHDYSVNSIKPALSSFVQTLQPKEATQEQN